MIDNTLRRGNTKVTIVDKSSGGVYATLSASVKAWTYSEEPLDDAGSDEGLTPILVLQCVLSAELVKELRVADAGGDLLIEISWLNSAGSPVITNSFTCSDIIISTLLDGEVGLEDEAPAMLELTTLVSTAHLMQPV